MSPPQINIGQNIHKFTPVTNSAINSAEVVAT